MKFFCFRKILAFSFVFIFIPAAFAAFENDLSISSNELTMQPAGGVVHGQTVKIYATVHSSGDRDLTGVVKFFVDGAQIATDQPVSVKSGGARSVSTVIFLDASFVVQRRSHVALSVASSGFEPAVAELIVSVMLPPLIASSLIALTVTVTV